MQWGISFKVDSDFDIESRGLPPPSHTRWITRMGDTKLLNILYHFQYAPQSWREWQRVASIKVQMTKRIKGIEFEYYDYNPYEITGQIYTIAELGKYFTAYLKYQKPLYPKRKNEFMRSLTLYTMRLHYEEMLHYEAVIAMAIHFNTTCKLDYSFRELNRKAFAILELDRDEWKVKLSEKERHRVLSNSALKAAQNKRDKSQPIREKAKALRADGKTLKDISLSLEISLSTVRRYLA